MCNVSRTIRPKGIIKSILSNTITMDVNYHWYQKHMYSFAISFPTNMPNIDIILKG